jgi:hypothetical protein
MLTTRRVTGILQPMRSFTDLFVDDMAVFSMSWQDHSFHLEMYRKIIKESGLTLSLQY